VKAKCGSILNNDDKTNKSSCLVKVGSDVNTNRPTWTAARGKESE